MKRLLAFALLFAALPAHAIIKSQPAASGAGGSVTSVSVTTANGFKGAVATATTTPAISIGTTVTGILVGNGSSVAAAAWSDVQALLSGTCSSATFVRGDGACAAVSLSTNVTGTLGVTNGGNGLATATLGDLRYGSGANTLAALPGNITAAKQFLTQTGTGTVSAIPAWAAIVAGDLPAGVPTAAANPSALVGPSVTNGSATTFTRSDGAPAINLAAAGYNWTTEHAWTLTGQTANTNVQGALFANTTAATTGNQQSNCIRIDGQGFGTTAGTSQPVSYLECVTPIQGTVPTVKWSILASINGGAYGEVMAATSGTTGTFTFDGTGNAFFNGTVTGTNFRPQSATPGVASVYLASAGTLGFAGAAAAPIGSWNTTNLISLVNIAVDTLGQGLQVKEGTNGKQGTCTLVGGTCTVTTNSVTANSRIFLTAQSLGTVAVPSGYGVSARTAGTSFTVLASAPTDTSVVAYEIFEPAP